MAGFSSCSGENGGAGGAPENEPLKAAPEPAPKADEGGPWFLDEAAARGITLLNRTGRPRSKELIMEAVGPGAAVFDADGDGRMDVYVPNGNWLEGPFRTQFYTGDDRPRNALYMQQADGTFRDEAKERGVDDDAWGFGCCAADLDNDGDQDLIVANLGPNRLYVNDGKGRFTDVAGKNGFAGPAEPGKWEWSTCASVGDYDRDGVLDVYVANYADMFEWLRTAPDVRRNPDGSIIQANVCSWQRLEVYCGPLGLPRQQDRLFRGLGGRDGELKVEDVTRTSKVWRPEAEGGPMYGFQVLFTDVNRDGWPDIYVANDSVPSFFFENQKDGTFIEKGKEYGIAVGQNGEDLAGMGADSADVNGDGLPDIHKTNFALQTNNLYIAESYKGRVSFRDFSMRSGVEEAVYRDLGWGVQVFDYDTGGDRDIFYANGHVYPEVDMKEAKDLNTTFDQFNRMFRNDSTADRMRFTQVDRDLGPGFDIRKGSRGASLLDLDEDGDLDILVINLNNTPDLLVNKRGAAAGHWLQLFLTGNPAKKSNRDAIGSWIVVRAGERVQHLEVIRGQGFLGCNDPRVHVGLGAWTGPVQLEITWPNGETTTHTIEGVDRKVRIAQE